MEITTLTLMLYFAAWTFSILLSVITLPGYQRKWVDWAKSTESDEDLLIILDPIVNEIEDRMHDKLEAFQASFLVH